MPPARLRRRRWRLPPLAILLALAGCAGFGLGGPAPLAGNPGLAVVEGHFATARAGRVVAYRGARLVIDAVAADPGDPGVTLYRLSRLEAGRRAGAFCPDGGLAFPLAGRWSRAGAHLRQPGAFTLVCLGSAVARCVRLGYRPWARTAGGISLWEANEACVRALKADYCGSGTAHSSPADPVVLYDRLAVRPLAAAPGMSFEAAWNAAGAVCVNHARAPGRITLRDLRVECANLPQSRLGDACDERDPGLVYSKSPVP
jgi:ADYC domain